MQKRLLNAASCLVFQVNKEFSWPASKWGLVLFLLLFNLKFADAQNLKIWDLRLGGSGEDIATQMVKTNRGDYLIAAYSNSPASTTKTENSRGGYDYWLICFDAHGNKKWDKVYGGSDDDFLRGIYPTSDGGCILAGSSNSPLSGDKSEERRGTISSYADYWIVKIDSVGNKQWDKTFGGGANDEAYSVIQTRDGKYLVAGASLSSANFDKTKNYYDPAGDYWILMLDGQGNKLWDNVYGSAVKDNPSNIIETRDGNFIISGNSAFTLTPSGNQTEPSKGTTDYWLLKIDSSGTILWDRRIGGDNFDVGSGVGVYGETLDKSIFPTQDGGFMLAGSSQSGISGDKSMPSIAGSSDYWIVKLDSTGAVSWDKTFGGTQGDFCSSGRSLPDGGSFIIGFSASGISGNKESPLKGNFTEGRFDYWLVRLDAFGNKTWENCFGGSGDEFAIDMEVDEFENVIMAGNASNYPILDGDLSIPTFGKKDIWIIKARPVSIKINNLRNDSLEIGEHVLFDYQIPEGVFNNDDSFVIELSQGAGTRMIALDTIGSNPLNGSFSSIVPPDTPEGCYDVYVRSLATGSKSNRLELFVKGSLTSDYKTFNKVAWFPPSGAFGNNDPDLRFSSPEISSGNSFTISFWIKPDLKSGEGQQVLNFGSKQGYFSDKGFILRVNLLESLSSGLFCHYWTGAAGFNQTDNQRFLFDLIPGSWQHLAIVVQNTTSQIYLNGRLLGEFQHLHPMPIQDQIKLGNGNWSGAVDDLAFFNRALSEAEINRLIQFGVNIQTEGLVHYWDFNDEFPCYTDTGIALLDKKSGTRNAIINRSQLIRETIPGYNHLIEPMKAGNRYPVKMKIRGGGFMEGCTASLEKSGTSPIRSDTALVQDANTLLVSSFDLFGAVPGIYDVIVHYPDQSKRIYPAAFTVEESELPEVWVNLIGNFFKASSEEDVVLLQVGNNGNSVAAGVPLYVSFDNPEFGFDTDFAFITPSDPAEREVFDQLPYYASYDTLGKTQILIPVLIPQIMPGEVKTYTLKFRHKPGEMSNYMVKAWTGLPRGIPLSEYSRGGNSVCTEAQENIECEINKITCLTSFIPVGGCIIQAAQIIVSSSMSAYCSINYGDSGPTVESSVKSLASLFLSCSGEQTVTWFADKVRKAFSRAADVAGLIDNCSAAMDDKCKRRDQPNRRGNYVNRMMRRVNSVDPNYIEGPEKWNRAGDVFHYSIHFENLASASAPAAHVLIADTLKAGMYDWSTLFFRSFTIGNKTYPINSYRHFNQGMYYQVDSGMIFLKIQGAVDTAANLIKVVFQSVDTLTGQPSENPFLGFLPPNVTSPEGEGFVSFSIRTLESLQTNDSLPSRAGIVFDENPTISTNQHLSIIDNDKPKPFASLPAEVNDTVYTVSWGGEDIGSGIMNYELYEAIDGGAFKLIGMNMPGNSVQLSGAFNKTYQYKMVAIDSAGNVSDESPVASVLLKPAGLMDISTSNPFMRCIPNPFAERAEILFDMPETSPGSIRVYTLTGIEVASVSGRNFPKGFNHVELNMKDLPPGMYLCKLKTDQGEAVQRIVKTASP